MIPGPDFIRRCAAETGFRPESLEKVVRLGEVMGAMASHPLLSRSLALKGGTALNLAYGPPTRLSVDLDFNFIATADVNPVELAIGKLLALLDRAAPRDFWDVANFPAIRHHLKTSRRARPE